MPIRARANLCRCFPQVLDQRVTLPRDHRQIIGSPGHAHVRKLPIRLNIFTLTSRISERKDILSGKSAAILKRRATVPSGRSGTRKRSEASLNGRREASTQPNACPDSSLSSSHGCLRYPPTHSDDHGFHACPFRQQRTHVVTLTM